MATVSNNAWAMNNDGFEDGLKNVFEPRKLADEEFKRGQGIIKDAYAIDEQQALLPTKLAQSMVDRRKAEANLQYYDANPNALVDAIGSEADRVRVFNENQIGENQAKITARNEQQARDELIASKSFITTPETKNPDGTVTPATERPTTEIERLELAQTAAPTYKMQQDIGAMVKAKYTDVVNQAIAQEDFVGAHEAAKKAGLITGDAKLTRLSDDTYTIQTTYGGTRQIGKQALQQMFFSQATKEKMAVNNAEAAGRIAVETVKGNYDLQGRRITADSNQAVAKTRADAQIGAAQIGYDRTIGAAEIRYGGTTQGAQGGEEAAFSRGGVAAQPTNQMINGTLPVSHNHPTYDKADELAAQKVGVPSEFLKSIRLYGERTNADKVSEAGARGVYQFIPSTRNAIKDKYGVDAWSTNPEEAATAAAYLIKENYEAAKAKPRGKTPEEEMFRLYHAGATAKRGKINEDYAARTMSGLRDLSSQSQSAAQPSAASVQIKTPVADRLRELTKKLTEDEQVAFERYIVKLPENQKQILAFNGNELTFDTSIQSLVNGFYAQRGKAAPPATQAPAMPQSTAPAMPQQAATEPSVKAAGTPDLPASQSAPSAELDPISTAFKETSVPELERMRNDLLSIQKSKGDSLEVRSLIGVIDEEIMAKTRSANWRQFKQDVASIGNGFNSAYNAYQDSQTKSNQAKKEQADKSRQNMLDLIKGLKELEQARKK